MVLRVMLFFCLLTSTVYPFDGRTCLTGYMTDIQTWVDEHGDLTAEVEPEISIDLSTKSSPALILKENIEYYISFENTVKYLSLAKCYLDRVPQIFHFKSAGGHHLFDTLEYLTLYGNFFIDTDSTSSVHHNPVTSTEDTTIKQLEDGPDMWYAGFENVIFTILKELDLRACCVEVIDEFVFRGMPNLEALYLGENSIHFIDDSTFDRLINLVHLDISRNEPRHLYMRDGTFSKMNNLRSIDMSFTKLHVQSFNTFSKLGLKVQRLSLCWTGVTNLTKGYFNNTSIKYLDISGNVHILTELKALKGLENSLQILYATNIRLDNFDVFKDLQKLEILKLTNNRISTIKEEIATTLTNLQVLDLGKNIYKTWLQPTFLGMRSLMFLSLKDNNINTIFTEMMDDFKDISYIGLSGNAIFCNCYTKELIETALVNELTQPNEVITISDEAYVDYNFNKALIEFNNIITRRKNISNICSQNDKCYDRNVSRNSGKYLIMDYSVNESYFCLLATTSLSVPFTEMRNCNTRSEINDDGDGLYIGINMLTLFNSPVILLLAFFVTFLLRKKIRYFFVTMKNSATLSFISNDEVIGEGSTYNYDVFVSYCHNDRAWMLDQLLPHLESDSTISVCLHERDFQVGLSILENIVSCMDRSRTIMLIISKQFLRIQWCQFEMHLAQHRLLETRREDLIIILLEEIPRHLRPTTLHYLMLTKTYIVWPKEESEQLIFWRRLKKSIVVQKDKSQVDLALT